MTRPVNAECPAARSASPLRSPSPSVTSPLESALHDARVRLTEIIQDSRSGMPRTCVLEGVRQLAGKLQAFVIRYEDWHVSGGGEGLNLPARRSAQR